MEGHNHCLQYGCAGSWGCALANILCENHHQVLLFDHTEQTINEINNEHQNHKVPGVIIDSSIKATLDIS